MHCIHIITVLRSFHHFFATHPIICYDKNTVSRKVAWLRVVTLAVAASSSTPPNLSQLACSLTLRKVSHANRSGRHYVDHLRMGSSAMSLPFMLMTSQVERRKLLISCLWCLLPATYCRFYRGVLPSGDQSHWRGFCTCDFLVDYGSLAIRMAPAGKRAQALSLIAPVQHWQWY